MDGILQKSGFGAGRVVARPPIDIQMIRSMAASGFSVTDVARAFSRGVPTIRYHADKNGIAFHVDGRARNGRHRSAATTRAETQEAPEPASLDGVAGLERLSPSDRAALAATGGRWRDLETWANKRGFSLRQAQSFWHLTGLPVIAGGVDAR